MLFDFLSSEVVLHSGEKEAVKAGLAVSLFGLLPLEVVLHGGEKEAVQVGFAFWFFVIGRNSGRRSKSGSEGGAGWFALGLSAETVLQVK